MTLPRICLDYNERKATAAAAVLLKMAPERRLPYLALMKLLYIAERESFRRRGRPIIGDTYVSMKHGPVLSGVLNLIKAEPDELGEADIWLKHLRKTGYDLELIADPGDGALTDSEVEILQEVFQKYGHMGKWDLRDYTHTFPEWRNPGESCFTIAPEAILRAIDKTEEQIAEIAERLDESARTEAFFRSGFKAMSG